MHATLEIVQYMYVYIGIFVYKIGVEISEL